VAGSLSFNGVAKALGALRLIALKRQFARKAGTQRITTLSKLGRKRSEKKAQLVRLGQREIETLGLSQGFWSDLYHRSMTVYWPVFFGSARTG
jgi:hypothetical protein